MQDTSESTNPPSSKKRIRVGVIILLCLGLGLVGLFGLRMVRSYRRIHDAGVRPFDPHRDPKNPQFFTDVEKIRPWMTISQVAKMYEIPEEYLFEALAIPAAENRNKSLQIINQEISSGSMGSGKGYVLEILKKTILRYQRDKPLPPPPGPPPPPPTPTPVTNS